MRHRLCRLGLLCAAGSLVTAAAAEGAADELVLLAEDDICSTDAGTECSVEFRQLRAAGRHLQVPATDVAAATTGAANGQAATPDDANASDDDDGEDGDGLSDGVPGGWGEPAELVRELEEADAYNISQGDVPAGGLQKQAGWHWGWASCRAYGCVNFYVSGRPCQCNPDCVRYGSCCWDYYKKCQGSEGRRRRRWAPAPAPAPAPSNRNIKTLYHNTSPQAGPLILKNGFRLGTQGWCGGGIYFAESAEATKTKAIGPDSHQGFLIEATVDVGTIKYMGATCDRQLTAQQVFSEHFDSVSFDPGDGREWVVYSKGRILSMKQYR